MPDILADIGTAIGSKLKDLSDRVTTLEGTVPAPTGPFTVEPVTWTNLSEIILSGEKLVNGNFSNSSYVQDTSFCLLSTCGLQPNNGHAVNHTFAEADRPKIIALQAYTSPTLTEGTIYRIKTVNTGNEAIQIENLDGTSVGWTAGGLRESVWEVVSLAFDNWTVTSGTLDQTKLASGIVKGDGGQVSIQQTFSQNIAQGTNLVIEVTSDHNIRFYPILSNGIVDTANSFDVLASDGFTSITTQSIVSGFRIGTLDSTREYSSVSIFQGEVAGGTVQTYAGGSIEKISGAGAYNAGASSVQKIDGNSDGYVQFQIAHGTHSLKIGLVNQDHDFEVDAPWKMNFGGGYIDLSSPWIADHTSFAAGDWFRIRHYSTSNEVHFQKRQTVYGDDTNFCLLQTCGLQPNNGHQYNHTFATVDRPLILAKETVNGLTAGEYYRIHAVNTSTGNTRIYTLDGVQIGWMTGRGTNWEVQQELGEDYVTFYTHPVLSNGSDLYVDTVFHAVGARLNDVQIATA